MPDKLDLSALWKLSYGLYIVASRSGERMNGQIANAIVQVTAEPPKIIVALNKNNLTHEFVAESGMLSISIIDTTADMQFIGTFGFKSGRDIDKMSMCAWKLLDSGCPAILDHSNAIIEGAVFDSVDVGTHTVFLADIISTEVLSDTEPMTYAYYHTVLKGKASKNAPTYRGANKPDEKKGGETMKYVCDICGYVYDPAIGDPDNGIDPGTPFDKLPDDWVCPVCGAGKDVFSPTD